MKNQLPLKYTELKINRDFGEIITVYFEFLKYNLKNFTNIFLRYNGIFMIALLLVSYLFVSGFMQLFALENSGYSEDYSAEFADTTMLIGIGALLFFLVFMAVAVLNYSLAGAYMIQYDRQAGQDFDRKPVWEIIRDRLGNIILFIFLLILIYIAVSIIGFILMIIPFIGVLAYYVLIFFIFAWFGVSFMYMLHENKGATEAYGEGWNLVYRNFWKSVGVNFVLGLLNGVLLLVVLIIPSVVLGFYTYHAVENDVDLTQGVVPTVVYTLGLCILLVVGVFNNCLTQFANGVLYFSLHEKTFRTNTRSRIEEIGSSEA